MNRVSAPPMRDEEARGALWFHSKLLEQLAAERDSPRLAGLDLAAGELPQAVRALAQQDSPTVALNHTGDDMNVRVTPRRCALPPRRLNIAGEDLLERWIVRGLAHPLRQREHLSLRGPRVEPSAV